MSVSASHQAAPLRRGGRLLSVVVPTGVSIVLMMLLIRTYDDCFADFSCFPCRCSTDSLASHRLENCRVAVSLRYRSLALNGTNIREVAPSAFHPLGCSVRHLSLSRNQLERLPPGLFSTLSCLRVLDLDSSGLVSLHEDAFQGLSKLDTLKLNQNNLTSLNLSIFSRVPALSTLQMGFNRLRRGL